MDFHDSKPILEHTITKTKPAFEWPYPQTVGPSGNIFDPSWYEHGESTPPQSLLQLPDAFAFLSDFFAAKPSILNPELPDIEFPPIVLEALRGCGKINRIDRYVIFTDGSSMSSRKHAPPAWLGEHDLTDAWAFLFLAEQHDESGDPQASTLEFLGWTSQLVVYQEGAPHHIGTQYVGAAYAEREALFWAGQWRLGVNDCIPTIFLSDSQTGCAQAVGLAGASTIDDSYRFLRATFQALESVLTGDGLRVQHVHGHNGCPWNEDLDGSQQNVEVERIVCAPFERHKVVQGAPIDQLQDDLEHIRPQGVEW